MDFIIKLIDNKKKFIIEFFLALFNDTQNKER